MEYKTMIEEIRDAGLISIPDEQPEIKVAIPLSEYEELLKAKGKVEMLESMIGKVESIYFKE